MAAEETTAGDAVEGEPSGWHRLTRPARSIRTRIVVGYVVLVTAALGITIVAMRQLLLARVDRDTNDMMARDTEELRKLATSNDPETGQPFGTDVEALFDIYFKNKVPDGDEFFVTYIGDDIQTWSTGSPLNGANAEIGVPWTGSDEPVRTRVQIAGERVEVLAVPVVADGVTSGTFMVLRTPASAHDDVSRVVRTLGLVGAGVAMLGLFGAWTVASRVLRPIAELTSTARTISDDDLSARIPVAGDDELAELGRRFNEMMDRVERGVVRQRQFLDDVAHELRTPITIISGHLETMGDDPAERAETIAIVTDELDRMNRYVSDLLLLAQAELPEFVQVGPVDVGGLIESLQPRLSAMADRNWVLDDSPQLGATTVEADHDRLVQAMVNLANNAVEHTDDGAEIGFGALASNGTVELWMRDTGPGVDPAVRDTLFDRAHRGPSSRARRPEGTGIGLSIVAAIAEAHGGTIRVDPSTTCGARFVVTLPLDHTAPRSQQQ